MFGNSAEYPETHEDISTCEAADYDPRSQKEQHERQPGGVIDALRTASQQAEVTDQLIESEFQRCGGKWNGDQWVIEDADLHPFCRAILALRPTAVPMNQDEVIAAIKSANISSSTTFWSIFEAGIRAAEAHQGITAQANKETP